MCGWPTDRVLAIFFYIVNDRLNRLADDPRAKVIRPRRLAWMGRAVAECDLVGPAVIERPDPATPVVVSGSISLEDRSLGD